MTKKIGHYLWMFPYDYDTGLGFMAVDLQKAGLKYFHQFFVANFYDSITAFFTQYCHCFYEIEPTFNEPII